MTVGEWRRAAAASLVSAGHPADSAQADTAAIARALLGWDTAAWLSRQDARLGPGEAARLDAAVVRRQAHEPVAYIVGEREFYGRAFRVTPAVLIPRPETELVVEAALGRLDALGTREAQVLDVGTGSGCIAITLACERPSVRATATDSSSAAIEIARDNCARHAVGTRVTLELTHLTGGRDAVCDLIVSNPPYVADSARDTLAADVRDFEPATALFGGPDGLAIIRDLLPAARRGLRPGGWFVMEFGADQRDQIAALADRAGFTEIDIRQDLAGLPRVLVARRPEASV